MADWALTVQELNEYVRKRLAGDPMLRGVRVRGEISGYRPHYSGHRYFILKDEASRINCVMFRQNSSGLDREIENGDQVTLTGSVSLFVRDGAYQFYVDEVEHEGAGALYQQLERLKKRLMNEGLFDPAVKQPLPEYPRTIGIVTSETGAAVRDMIRVAKQRNPQVGILLRPAQVQGPGAAEDIARGIEELNENGRADVILVGRGGGSIEELWAFNEEIVARAIYNSRIPIVSCVGHEVDTTIADFVADVRAATPSQAAEIAVPVREELVERLSRLKKRADGLMEGKRMMARNRLKMAAMGAVMSHPQRVLIEERRKYLQNWMQHPVMRDPQKVIIRERQMQLIQQRSQFRLLDPRRDLLEKRRQELNDLFNQLKFRMDQKQFIEDERKRLEAALDRFIRRHERQQEQARMALEVLKQKTLALNPNSVLGRGYAVVYELDKTVESTKQLRKNQRVRVRLADGSFGAVVTDVNGENEE